jgi:hypothetical protein
MYRYLLIAVFALSTGAFAADVSVSGGVAAKSGSKSVSVAFSVRDKQVIKHYYKKRSAQQGNQARRNGKGTPPGQAKRDGKTPPGLAKQGGLPRGVAKQGRLPKEAKTETLPRELENKLSRLPDSYVRVRVGNDFVILDKKTRVVLDIARGLGGV